jgi:putative transposase
MAKRAVAERGLSIRVVCEAFDVSQSCYRYEDQTTTENEEIANWLLRLSDNHRNWGFGLSSLYLQMSRAFAGSTNGCIAFTANCS